MIRRLLPLLLLVLCVAALASCTSSGGAKRVARFSNDRFSGLYEGTWQSESTKHRGRLRCQFTKVAEGRYEARFKAWWGLLSGSYTVPFETRERGGVLYFKGEHDLGKLFGGVFRSNGTVKGDRFHSTFTARGDTGTFTMQRVR